VPLAEPPEPEDSDEQERIRTLQLRMDFYRAKQEDYVKLFQAYVDLADSVRARSVLASLQRHIGDLGVRASVAPTVSAQVDIEDRIDQLKVLHNDMNKRVPKVEVPIGGATGGAQDGVP
jgi:hypothetical protein